MGYTNSPMVVYTKLSPNHSGQRTMAIDRITPHCVVGQCTAEGLGDWFYKSSTQASSNYGIDKDGDPKNIYSLVQRMKDLASSVQDGQNWTDAQYDEFDRLVGKLEDASSEFKVEYTDLDAGTTKLKNNLALLEENFYNLQEQYAALEDVDMADSLTSFVWAQYCYNAALKVGNNVLSESLMDYLN